MDARKLIVTLFTCVGIGIGVGAILGGVVGTLSPNLILKFLGPFSSTENALKDGVALGLLDGGIYGFFGGLVVIVLATISARRKPDA